MSIWDTTKNVSLVEYLGFGTTGMNFSDALPANLAPSGGLTLDFGTLTGFSSTFAGSDVANLVYEVTAGKSFGAAATQAIETTGPLSGSLGTPPIPNNGNVTTINTAINTFFGQVNAACPSSVGCSSDSSTNLNTAAFAGQPSFGGTYGGGLSQANASGAVGSALAFYLVTKTGSVATTAATTQQYANASGIGQWMLSTGGHLTYSIAGVSAVPLPAAVWLLLSGLSGLVTIGRRRTEAQAA